MGEHVNIQQMVLFYSPTLYSFHMLQHGFACVSVQNSDPQTTVLESDRNIFSRNLHLINDCSSKTEENKFDDLWERKKNK